MQTFSCGMHTGSSSLTRDRTRAPCIGSAESHPLDPQGSPSASHIWWGTPLFYPPFHPQDIGQIGNKWGDLRNALRRERQQQRGAWVWVSRTERAQSSRLGNQQLPVTWEGSSCEAGRNQEKAQSTAESRKCIRDRSPKAYHKRPSAFGTLLHLCPLCMHNTLFMCIYLLYSIMYI